MGPGKMKEDFLGFVSFITISILIAVLCHKKITNFILACVASSIISVMLHQLIFIIILGYLDPFVLIALPKEIAVALVVAILVGIPFAYTRWKGQRKGESAGP